MRNVYIARHGHREDFGGAEWTPTWKLSAGRRYDPALSALGQQQARDLGLRLKDAGIGQIFCSPFLRAVETAHIVAEVVDAPVCIEEGLGEWLNPEWYTRQPELLAPIKLKEWFPRIDLSYQSKVRRSFPEADEVRDVWPKVAVTVRELLRNTEGDLLLVGHGSSVGGMMRTLCGPDAPIAADLCALFHCRQQDTEYWEVLLGGESPDV